MPEPPNRFHQILPAQKLLGEHFLNLPIHIVKEHVRHSVALPVTCHNGRREYRRHSSRSFRVIPSRRVDHYQVPLSPVHFLRQLRQHQPAPALLADLSVRRQTFRLRFVRSEQPVGIREVGPIPNRMGVENRSFADDGLDPLGVFFEEKGGPTGVE